MKLPVVLIGAGIILIALGGWSLWAGKTIGLYGMVETRSSPFYWIIVAVLFSLGGLNVWFGIKSLLQ